MKILVVSNSIKDDLIQDLKKLGHAVTYFHGKTNQSFKHLKFDMYLADYNQAESCGEVKKHNSKALTVVMYPDNFPKNALKQDLFKNRINIIIQENIATKNVVHTLDGAEVAMTASETLVLLQKLMAAKFYKTKIVESINPILFPLEEEVLKSYPKYSQYGMVFGCFAVKREIGFITTTRGKKLGLESISEVLKVDHEQRVVEASTKATLNAPLLSKMFELNPSFIILIHGHELIGEKHHLEYEFAGTDGDLKFAKATKSGQAVLLPEHGYLVGFETMAEYLEWVDGK